MVNESKTFIRLVDEDGFETRIDLMDNADFAFLFHNLKIGTKVHIRYEGRFGMDGIIVEPDAKLPD